MSRKALIAANWKMNKTPAEAKAFVDAFLPLVAGHTRDEIAIFPSVTSLATVVEAAAASNIAVGLQNMHFAELVSDRAYVLEKGQIRFSGTIEELARDEAVRRAYLSV